MKRIYCFFMITWCLTLSGIFVNAQDRVEIYPQANNLKVYVFDSQLKFIKYIPVQQKNVIPFNSAEFLKNKYLIAITSTSGYYYVGTSQQIAAKKKIQLTQSAPLPWIKIADGTRLITSQNQYINIHAHGGLTYSLENDLIGIIKLKLLGFNGFRLVFRSFNLASDKLPGLYLKTTGPFNQTISGFTDAYINEYIVPKINLAKLLGMYVILDHHAMFINDKNVSGDYETNPNYYKAWLDLWNHLSTKFKDEPAIAFYEVQNEPGSDMSQEFVLKMHNDVIKLIRKNDADHIIAFGHSWGNISEQFFLNKGIPYDADKKLIYTMHHYYKTAQPNGGLTSKIANAVKIGQKYKIPIWFGESGFKDDYSTADLAMMEQWYDFADRNFISTSLWWDDDIRGKRKDNNNADYINALDLKKRVFLSESNNWNIRCYRKDDKNGHFYTIGNPDAAVVAHIQINYPIMDAVSFSTDNAGVKITRLNGCTKIDGNFKTIGVTLN